MDEAARIERLLEVIESDIVPLTRTGVEQGNKIFGAAVLRKADLSLVLAATNNEIENPLWHGEVHLIKRFHELPAADRPAPRELIFLATHEPCSLCLSAITWAGYDNFHYLFSHEDSRDAFAIPHDLRILKEVFRLEPGGYAHANHYWQCHHLGQLIEACGDDDRARLQARVERLNDIYAQMSAVYQRAKGGHGIPLD